MREPLPMCERAPCARLAMPSSTAPPPAVSFCRCTANRSTASHGRRARSNPMRNFENRHWNAYTLIVLVIQRLGFGISLGDRPMLLLAALLVVLGIQIFAIALIGEIVIFTHAKDISHTGRPVPDTGSDCRARKRRLAGIPQRSAGFYAGSPTFQWVDQRPSMRNSRPDWYRAMRWRMAVASSRSPRRSAASTAR